MMLLGIRVAMGLLPQWSELWTRLDRIVRAFTEGESYAAVSAAVKESAESYWSHVLDADVRVEAIECPLPGGVLVKGLTISNPRSAKKKISRVLCIVTLHNKYTRALTCDIFFVRASSARRRMR